MVPWGTGYDLLGMCSFEATGGMAFRDHGSLADGAAQHRWRRHREAGTAQTPREPTVEEAAKYSL